MALIYNFMTCFAGVERWAFKLTEEITKNG